MSIELTRGSNGLDGRPDDDAHGAAVTCLSLLTFLLVGPGVHAGEPPDPDCAGPVDLPRVRQDWRSRSPGFFAVDDQPVRQQGSWARLDQENGRPALHGQSWSLSSLAVALAPVFVVFLVGRALVGIAIGGFWSLSTAILARLASGPDLPKAIALLQGGTAIAIVLAAPLGSFLGSLIR